MNSYNLVTIYRALVPIFLLPLLIWYIMRYKRKSDALGENKSASGKPDPNVSQAQRNSSLSIGGCSSSKSASGKPEPNVSQAQRNSSLSIGGCSSSSFTTKSQDMIRQKLLHQTTSKVHISTRPTLAPHNKSILSHGIHAAPDATTERSCEQSVTVLTKSSSPIPQTETSAGKSQSKSTAIATTSHLGPTSLYKDLGDCEHVCQYCSATFWYEERSKQRYGDGRIHYNKCCNAGKVNLPIPPGPPEYIKGLFTDPHFMDNIRAYNSMFSMTSFGASVDENINNGSGPYVFRLCGQIYHWIGTLCPPPGDAPKFLQLYICDTRNEVRNRISHFGGEHTTTLKEEIVARLIKFLDKHNHLVKLFRTARDKCADHEIPEFHIRLFNKPKNRQYELPITDGLGAVVFETGHQSQNDYDVIIHSKEGFPQRINKLHPAYMSMQFPLLFV